MEDVLKKFDELYHDMISDESAEKMRELAKIGKWFAVQVATSNPKLVREAVEKLESTTWNNYLSESEAVEIVSQFVNQNGAKGAKWGFGQFAQFVESIDGAIEDKPYYNRYALWVTANMIYSDHYRTLSEFIDDDKLRKTIYKLAVEKLRDPDRPCFIREYFGL